tara:strand:- start:303 stop:1145 length:843 start_codon:yes stop_codon:yes gene_type:complete
MIRAISTIVLLLGSGTLFVAAYVHPVSASGEYRRDGDVLKPGFHLDWFWQKPSYRPDSTFGTVNADAAKQHPISVPSVVLRWPSRTDAKGQQAYEFTSVIKGSKAATPEVSALATLKAAAIEAEGVALQQEQRVAKRARAHVDAQLNLQAQQEITYASKLNEFQKKLLKIDQDSDLAISVRTAEAEAVSTRTKADIESGRQRLQALRDGLVAEALKHEGAKNFLRMEVIRRLGSSHGDQPAPNSNVVSGVQDFIEAIESIGQRPGPNPAQRGKRIGPKTR